MDHFVFSASGVDFSHFQNDSLVRDLSLRDDKVKDLSGKPVASNKDEELFKKLSTYYTGTPLYFSPTVVSASHRVFCPRVIYSDQDDTASQTNTSTTKNSDPKQDLTSRHTNFAVKDFQKEQPDVTTDVDLSSRVIRPERKSAFRNVSQLRSAFHHYVGYGNRPYKIPPTEHLQEAIVSREQDHIPHKTFECCDEVTTPMFGLPLPLPSTRTLNLDRISHPMQSSLRGIHVFHPNPVHKIATTFPTYLDVTSVCDNLVPPSGNEHDFVNQEWTSHRVLQSLGQATWGFHCDICQTVCSSSEKLKNHFRSHSGEKPHMCYCGRAFARNEELTRHRRIHTGLRPHLCQVCGKTFGRKDHLNKHRNTHLQKSEKKMHICEVTGCYQRYTRSDALARHQWTAHGIKAKASKWRSVKS